MIPILQRTTRGERTWIGGGVEWGGVGWRRRGLITVYRLVLCDTREKAHGCADAPDPAGLPCLHFPKKVVFPPKWSLSHATRPVPLPVHRKIRYDPCSPLALLFPFPMAGLSFFRWGCVVGGAWCATLLADPPPTGNSDDVPIRGIFPSLNPPTWALFFALAAQTRDDILAVHLTTGCE